MISRIFCCVVLALVMSGGASAQVYRCTIDGKVVFSGTPCALGAEPITVTPASGAGNRDDAVRAQTQARRDARTAQDIEQRHDDIKSRRGRTYILYGPTD